MSGPEPFLLPTEAAAFLQGGALGRLSSRTRSRRLRTALRDLLFVAQLHARPRFGVLFPLWLPPFTTLLSVRY